MYAVDVIVHLGLWLARWDSGGRRGPWWAPPNIDAGGDPLPADRSFFARVHLLRSRPVQQQGLAGRFAEGVQLGRRAALYCRISTADQSCERQERNLAGFAVRAGYEVVGTCKETASGVRLDRAERRKVLALAQRREIDAVANAAHFGEIFSPLFAPAAC